MTTETKTVFNFSRWPSARMKRLGMRKLVEAVHDAGPLWQARDACVEAAATFMAESGS